MALVSAGLLIYGVFLTFRPPLRSTLPSGEVLQLISVTDGRNRLHPSGSVPLIFQLTNWLGMTSVQVSPHGFPQPTDDSILLIYLQYVNWTMVANGVFRHSSNLTPLVKPLGRINSGSVTNAQDGLKLLAFDPDGFWASQEPQIGFSQTPNGAFFQVGLRAPPADVRNVRLVLFGPVDPNSPGTYVPPSTERPILWSMTVPSPRWDPKAPKVSSRVPNLTLPLTVTGSSTSATIRQFRYPVAPVASNTEVAKPWKPPGDQFGLTCPPGLEFELEIGSVDSRPRRNPVRHNASNLTDSAGKSLQMSSSYFGNPKIGTAKVMLGSINLDTTSPQLRISLVPPYDDPVDEVITTYTLVVQPGSSPGSNPHQFLSTPLTTVTLTAGNRQIFLYPNTSSHSWRAFADYKANIETDLWDNYHIDWSSVAKLPDSSDPIQVGHSSGLSQPSGGKRLYTSSIGPVWVLGTQPTQPTTGTLTITARLVRKETLIFPLNW
jgi:hypothetical protein